MLQSTPTCDRRRWTSSRACSNPAGGCRSPWTSASQRDCGSEALGDAALILDTARAASSNQCNSTCRDTSNLLSRPTASASHEALAAVVAPCHKEPTPRRWIFHQMRHGDGFRSLAVLGTTWGEALSVTSVVAYWRRKTRLKSAPFASPNAVTCAQPAVRPRSVPAPARPVRRRRRCRASVEHAGEHEVVHVGLPGVYASPTYLAARGATDGRAERPLRARAASTHTFARSTSGRAKPVNLAHGKCTVVGRHV